MGMQVTVSPRVTSADSSHRVGRRRTDRAVIPVLIALDVILAVVLVITGGTAGVQTFATVFLGIFIEAMPFVLIGALVSGVIGVFVRDETVGRLLPRGRLAAPVVGSLLGLIFPVCECGVVPVTRRLVHKGASVGLGVAFLFASPVINPIVLWSTFAAFGGNWHMVAWRAGLTFAVATLVGVVFAFHPDGRTLLKAAPTLLGYHPLPPDRHAAHPHDHHGQGTHDGHSHSDSHDDHDHTAMPFLEKLRHVCEHSAQEFFEMGKFLVFGAILASLLQSLIPRQTLLSIGQSPVGSVIAMVLLAVVLSVCSTVDAFLVLTFAGTFTTGALLAFLVFGPMVDIKSTLMFLTVFKGRAVVLMIALAAQLVLLATIWINLNIT
jgi:uncharacterized membrane protein YraQ (UPF0718 family)